MRQPKTKGLEWLNLSMASFNGSGYADKSSAVAYIESYVAFKRLKKQWEAVEILKRHYNEATTIAEYLLDAAEAGHTPSEKNYQKFWEFYQSGGGVL